MTAAIRVVLFDAVGTLIHPAQHVSEVYALAGRRHGSAHDADSIEVRFPAAFARHDGLQETCEQYEISRWRRIVTDIFDDVPDAAESLFVELWTHFANPAHWSLYDDVLPTWNWLRQQNVVVGIASNFDARLEGICRACHPLDQVEHLFISSAIGFPKPRPEFYAHIEKTLNVPAEDILMVGDNRANDVDAARAIGWQAAWIDRRQPNTAADAINNLSAIRDVFWNG